MNSVWFYLSVTDIILGLVMLRKKYSFKLAGWREGKAGPHEPWHTVEEFEERYGHNLKETEEPVQLLYVEHRSAFHRIAGKIVIAVGAACILMKFVSGAI